MAPAVQEVESCKCVPRRAWIACGGCFAFGIGPLSAASLPHDVGWSRADVKKRVSEGDVKRVVYGIRGHGREHEDTAIVGNKNTNQMMMIINDPSRPR